MDKTFIKRVAIIVCVVLIGLFAYLGLMFFGDCFGSPYYENIKKQSNFISTQIKINKDSQLVFDYQINIDLNSIVAHQSEIDGFKNRLSLVAEEKLDSERQQLSKKFEKEKIDKAIEFIEPHWNGETLFYQIIFSNIDVFDKNCENVAVVKTDKTFLAFLKFEFVSNLFAGEDYKSVLNRIYDCAEGTSFQAKLIELYKPNFYFDFSSKVRRASSNADYFLADENFYHHVWELGESSLDRKISVSLRFIQFGWWYLIGLATPLAFMVFAVLYILIYDKFKNKKSRIEIEKN